jgi:hypothetical protein
MADVSVELGLDAASFDKGLATAGQNLGAFGGRAAGSLRGVTDAGENLLRSNHRVATQIHRFSQDLLSGADASQLFTTGLEGIGRSLNLSLGALAGIGIGAAAVQQISKIIAEYKQLHKEAEAVADLQVDPFHQTISSIESTEKRAHEMKEKLQDEQAGTWNFVKRQITDFVESKGAWGLFRHPTTGATVQEDLEKQQQKELEARVAEWKKARQKNDFEESLLGSNEPSYMKEARRINQAGEEKLGEAAQKGMGAFMEAVRSTTIELEKLAQKVAQQNQDRVKETLGEIAQRPAIATGGETYGFWKEGEMAREALKEKDLGEKARLAGDQTGAEQHFQRAGQIENQLGSLKDSDKNMAMEVAAGCNAAAIFQEMLSALKNHPDFRNK